MTGTYFAFFAFFAVKGQKFDLRNHDNTNRCGSENFGNGHLGLFRVFAVKEECHMGSLLEKVRQLNQKGPMVAMEHDPPVEEPGHPVHQWWGCEKSEISEKRPGTYFASQQVSDGSLLDKVRRLKQEKTRLGMNSPLPPEREWAASQQPSSGCEISEKRDIQRYPGVTPKWVGAASPRTPSWLPPDASDLLTRWEELGRPEIPLSPGVLISNLQKWLYFYEAAEYPPEHLSAVRLCLWERLPANEIPATDPLLEEWRRVSIPEWRGILQESVQQGNSRREEYARWMLQDILSDPDYQEQEA
jgi:hypothetical protein